MKFAIYRLKTKSSKTYYKFCVVDLKTSTYGFGNSIKAARSPRVCPKPEEETLEQTGYGVQLLRKKYKLIKLVK